MLQSDNEEKQRKKGNLENFVNLKTPTWGFELTTSGLEVEHTPRQKNSITNCLSFNMAL